MASVQPLPNPGATTPPRLENIIDFNGGLNTISNRIDLKPGETPDCNNVDIDRRGGINRRSSAIAANNTGGTNLTSIPGVVGIGSSGETMYFSNWSFTDLTGAGTAVTTMATGPKVANAAKIWSFQLNANSGATYIQNASRYGTTVATWSGAGRWQDSFSSPSGVHAPDARVAAFHLAYTFVGYTGEYVSGTVGSSAVATMNANRLRWSHPGDGGSWRSLDFIDIGYLQEPIIGLVSCGDHLLILKAGSVWALHGYSAETFNLVNVTTAVGCSGRLAFGRAPSGEVYFFDSTKGLCRYDGHGGIQLLAEKVATLFPPYVPPTGLSGYEGSFVYGMYDTVAVAVSPETGRVWCALPDSSTRGGSTPENNFCLVYDPLIDAWTKNDIKAWGFIPFRGRLVGWRLQRTFTVENETGTRDTYTGSTVHVDAYWVSPWHMGGQPVVPKRWTKPEFIITGNQVGTFVVTVYKDYDPITVEKTITIASTNPLSSSSDYDLVFRTQVVGTAKSVAIKFSGPTAEHVLWRLDGYTLKYKTKAVRS